MSGLKAGELSYLNIRVVGSSWEVKEDFCIDTRSPGNLETSSVGGVAEVAPSTVCACAVGTSWLLGTPVALFMEDLIH